VQRGECGAPSLSRVEVLEPLRIPLLLCQPRSEMRAEMQNKADRVPRSPGRARQRISVDNNFRRKHSVRALINPSRRPSRSRNFGRQIIFLERRKRHRHLSRACIVTEAREREREGGGRRQFACFPRLCRHRHSCLPACLPACLCGMAVPGVSHTTCLHSEEISSGAKVGSRMPRR